MQVRHFELFVAAGVDTREWLEVDVNIQRHAMETGTAPNPESYAGQLPAFNIDARRIGSSRRFNVVFGDQINDALFKCCHQSAHSNVGAANVNQRVDH